MVTAQSLAQTTGGPPLARRYDVDWLRVLGMMTVFLFHCARFFDTGGWHVKSPETSEAVSFVTLTLTVQWMMPLFFLLSGIGVYHALGVQQWPQYLASRFKRLAVPLLFGTFVVIAPYQVYLERVSQGRFAGPFWRFYPHYFEGWYGIQENGNFAWMGIHLWYLEVLFVFSVICLPLFLLLRSRPGGRLMDALSRRLAIPGLLFVLAIPIIIMEFIANSPSLQDHPLGLRDFGGWSLLPYLALFVLGYLVAGGRAAIRAIETHRLVALAVTVLTFVATHILVKQRGLPESSFLFAVLRGMTCWASLLAICGFASRHLRFSNAFLKYANDAVLPFYILHQTVILAIGFHVIRLDAPLWAEYLIIAVSSFAAIVAAYEFFIKRTNLLRVLFGMKPIRRVQPAPVVQSLISA